MRAVAWETQEIRISIASTHDWKHVGTPLRWEMVQGDTMPGNCLGVTASRKSSGAWCITHRPSGMGLTVEHFPSRELAREIAIALNALGDWHRSLDEIAADGALVLATRQTIAAMSGRVFKPLPRQWFIPDESTSLVRRIVLPEVA